MAMIDPNIDPMGLAMQDFFNGEKDAVIRVDTNLTEDEELPAEHLFRGYDELPVLEKEAINLCKGRALDVGCGSGCHSVILQERGVDVKAVDISLSSCGVATQQGVKDVECVDFFKMKEEKFDTLYFLMNGIGLVQTMAGFEAFFNQAKELLNKGGQILLDSSDIIYMFEEEDGSVLVDLNAKYYGEMEYVLSYKGVEAAPFLWLYVGFEILQDKANEFGFNCEKLMDGDHYNYLARLTVK